MSESPTRARRVQKLRDVLRDHGLTEDPGPEVEHAQITDHGGGTATVREVTEDGVIEYQASFPTPDEDDDHD